MEIEPETSELSNPLCDREDQKPNSQSFEPLEAIEQAELLGGEEGKKTNSQGNEIAKEYFENLRSTLSTENSQSVQKVSQISEPIRHVSKLPKSSPLDKIKSNLESVFNSPDSDFLSRSTFNSKIFTPIVHNFLICNIFFEPVDPEPETLLLKLASSSKEDSRTALSLFYQSVNKKITLPPSGVVRINPLVVSPSIISLSRVPLQVKQGLRSRGSKSELPSLEENELVRFYLKKRTSIINEASTRGSFDRSQAGFARLKKAPLDSLVQIFEEKQQDLNQRILLKLEELKRRAERAQERVQAPEEAASSLEDLMRNLKSDFVLPKLFSEQIRRHEQRNHFGGPQRMVFCQVCNGEESVGENSIVECSKCPLLVHKLCYSFEESGQGELLCDACKHFKGDEGNVCCLLCPQKGKAVKRVSIEISRSKLLKRNPVYFASQPSEDSTEHQQPAEKVEKDLAFSQEERMSEEANSTREISHNVSMTQTNQRGKRQNRVVVWMHLSCLFWTTEINFRRINDHLEIKNFIKIPKENFTYKCSVCGVSSGAVIRCAVESCRVRFHVECGRKHGAHLFVTPGKVYGANCFDHNPIFLTNRIRLNERIAKEEVEKFVRHLKNLADQSLGSCTTVRRRSVTGSLLQKRPEPQNFVIEEGVSLDEDLLQVLKQVKEALSTEPEVFSRVGLARDSLTQEFSIRGVQEDPHRLCERKLCPESKAILQVATKLKLSPFEVFTKFSAAQNFIRNFKRPLHSFSDSRRPKACNSCRKTKDVPVRYCDSCSKSFHVICMKSLLLENSKKANFCKKCFPLRPESPLQPLLPELLDEN